MERLIELLKYLLLGFIQGIAEVLPISSSGHLVIVQQWLNMPSTDLTFEVFLHVASLLAVILFLRKKLWYLIQGFFRYLISRHPEDFPAFRYAILLVVATIPTAVIAFLFKDLVESLSSLLAVGVLLLLNGAMLLLTRKLEGSRTIQELPYWKAALIGVFQSIGIFPGISRSGATISGSLFQGIRRSDAAEFAFLLFIPAVAGATILELPDFVGTWNTTLTVPYLVGFVVSFLATYASFHWLLNVVRKGKLHYFSYYCFLIGAVAIITGLL